MTQTLFLMLQETQMYFCFAFCIIYIVGQFHLETKAEQLRPRVFFLTPRSWEVHIGDGKIKMVGYWHFFL